MPQELAPLLARDDADAARERAEAAAAHEAAIEALLSLGATRRPAPAPEEYWSAAA